MMGYPDLAIYVLELPYVIIKPAPSKADSILLASALVEI
jgi:hypothetical protein